MRADDGRVTDALDIRRPIGIEIEFDVLQAGNVVVPNYVFTNEEGICVFHPHDWADDWRGKPRAPGRYSRTGWVPGNLLPEGTFFVGVALSSYNPDRRGISTNATSSPSRFTTAWTAIRPAETSAACCRA